MLKPGTRVALDSPYGVLRIEMGAEKVLTMVLNGATGVVDGDRNGVPYVQWGGDHELIPHLTPAHWLKILPKEA